VRYVPSASGYLPVGRYDDGHFAYYVLGMSTDRFNRPTVGFFIAGLPTAKTERTVVVSPIRHLCPRRRRLAVRMITWGSPGPPHDLNDDSLPNCISFLPKPQPLRDGQRPRCADLHEHLRPRLSPHRRSS
jgi:hypothetical protein